MNLIKKYLENVNTINELPTLNALIKLSGINDYHDVYEMLTSLDEAVTIKDGTRIRIESEKFHFNCDNEALKSYEIIDTNMSICMTCGEILIDKSNIRDKVLSKYKTYDRQHAIEAHIENIVFPIEMNDYDTEQYYKKQCEKYIAK